MKKTKWFDRKFPPIEDNGVFPGILERLEYTHLRIQHKVAQLPAQLPGQLGDAQWSIKKEIGHLIDLEPLWYERMRQIINGDPHLKVADLSNRQTHETDHDRRTIDGLVRDFAAERAKMMELLRHIQPAALENTAVHPRLGTPMRLVDLAFFVAEHDDHHLAQITELSRPLTTLTPTYTIENTVPEDLPLVYSFFEEAIAYQQRKGYPVWAGFDKQNLQNDVADGMQFKIVIDGHMAAIFSICYRDPIIWREKDRGDALYLHRVVVNPRYKGQKQFEKVMHWAKNHAAQRQIPYLRMDTWGHNTNIIAYYESFGFRLVEYATTPNDEGLPVQNRNLYVALLEYTL